MISTRIDQMDGKQEELETINVWELMSGLDDDESSPRSMSFPAIPVPKHSALSPALAAKLSSDSFTLEPANERPRPPWQPPLPKADRRHARSSVIALEDPIANTQAPPLKFGSVEVSSSNTSSLFDSVSGSDTASFEALADNLQRSLSFKLVFDSQKKGSLGPEDTLFPGVSKDDCTNEASTDSTPKRRSSEGDSTPTTASTRPLFSRAAKLKKLFKANKGALKLPIAMKGGSKQEGQPKKLPAHWNVLPTLSSGNALDGSSSRKGSDSGSSCKVSESAGSSCRGSDEFPELSSEPVFVNAGVNKSRVMEVGQGGPVRRYRHSFSNGNPNRGSIEESTLTPMNRPSSWELEKVVVDSGAKAVLYSTNLRTDVNAYEDSNAVRAILISLVGAAFDEKCVSQNSQYEQELKSALNLPVVAVPTICVRGKFIAGIDNIMQFFKKGILGALLLDTLPHGSKSNATCLCRGGKFLICPICKGKRKLTRPGEDTASCRHCIGTGLLKCPSCPKQ